MALPLVTTAWAATPTFASPGSAPSAPTSAGAPQAAIIDRERGRAETMRELTRLEFMTRVLFSSGKPPRTGRTGGKRGRVAGRRRSGGPPFHRCFTAALRLL